MSSMTLPSGVTKGTIITGGIDNTSNQMIPRFSMKYPADLTSVSLTDLVSTGRVYIYFEDELTLGQLGLLEDIYKTKHLSPQFRGAAYASSRQIEIENKK